jgi:hypothetical protein
MNKVVWVQIKLEEEKVLLKQYVSLHCFVEGKTWFVHIGHLNLEKTFCLNIQVSLKQAARVLHTLVRPNCTNKWLCNNFWKLRKKWQKDFNMHVHSNEGDVIKMHQNVVTIVLMSYTLSKLYVDMKFDMFNMKFKNHLFCQIKVHSIDWLIIYIVIFELLETDGVTSLRFINMAAALTMGNSYYLIST